MTKKEVLDWLYRIKSKLTMYFPIKWVSECEQAIDYAIKALKNQKTGHWTETDIYVYECSECGCKLVDEQIYIPRNFCPNCGAKMDKTTVEKPFNRTDDCLSYEESFCEARDCGECCCREIKGE